MLLSLFLLFCALLPFQFALNPTEGVDLAIARIVVPVLFLLIFCDMAKKRPGVLKDKMAWLIIVFLFLASASLFFSHEFSWSLRKLLFLLTIFPVYFIANHLLSRENFRKIMSALVLGSSALAVLGIIQFLMQFVIGIDPLYDFLAKCSAPIFLGDSFSQAVLAHPSWLVSSSGTTYMRAFAIFPDPHMFSYYLEMLLPFSIALWATSLPPHKQSPANTPVLHKLSCWQGGMFRKKLFLSSSLLLTAALIFSFTRGSYIALILGSFAIIPLVPKEAAKKLLLAAAFLFLIFIAIPHNPVSQRFISSFDPSEGSNAGRIQNWQQAARLIISNPLGVGIGMYPLSIEPGSDYRTPVYAHNLFLDVAAELGVFAAIILTMILSLAFARFARAGKNDPFFFAGASSIAIFSAHSLVETPLYSVHVLILLLIILASSSMSQKQEYEKVSDN